MDTRDWLILHTLFKEKNITKAGQSLYIAQPTLMKRLQQLETEFGVKIVNRGSREYSLLLKSNIWQNVRRKCYLFIVK